MHKLNTNPACGNNTGLANAAQIPTIEAIRQLFDLDGTNEQILTGCTAYIEAHGYDDALKALLDGFNKIDGRDWAMMLEQYVPDTDARSAGPAPEIQKMNDADLLGEDHPEMQELLQKPFVFMTGSMYGQKDHRNTQDGNWNRGEMPLVQWIAGGDEGKTPWGLTRHPVAKRKEGPAVVLADALDGARKDAAIKTMYAIGLDIDSGAALDDVLVTLEEKGLFAVVYTSFRHGTTELVLMHDDIMRKLKLDKSPTRAQIQTYLREHHKDRYDASFIDQIKVVDARKQTPDGLRTILKTPPLDKFRVILPLWEPVELADLGATVNDWKNVWADAVTGVAVNTLGVNFDATSCDVNRLFYVPRHPADAEDWYSAIVQGRPLRFEEIEPFSKTAYVKDRDAGDAFAQAGGGSGGTDTREEFLTPSGRNLNKWHNKHKDRWLAADAIETFCPDKVRVAGGEKPGTVHLECPFEYIHSSEGGTATMAMNPDENEMGYWTIFCKHDSCQERDKLEFIQEMLAQGWCEEDVLWDDDWNIPLPDEDLEDGENESEHHVYNLDPEKAAAAVNKEGIDKGTSVEKIREFLGHYVECDSVTKNNLTDVLAGPSRGKGVAALSNKEVSEIWAGLDKQAARKKIEKDAKKREKLDAPDYLPLEQATKNTVEKAAKASKWLPEGFTYQDGYFGKLVTVGNDLKFNPTCNAFEVVYCADGSKGLTRTNQLTIRYMHRSENLGIVESTFRIGDTYKDQGALLGDLRNEGLEFSPDAPTQDILALLRAVSSEREGVYRAQSGWTDARDAFIAPTGESIKKDDDPRLYVLEKAMRVSGKTCGTVVEYAGAMNTAIRGKNAKLFLPGALLGAVGNLADFINTEHAVIIANEGKKNSGKTTSLKAGVSFFAVASVEGLMFSANGTETAFEAMAMKASGAAMAPDDSGASKRTADDEQRQIYQYANRMGRGRGTTTGGLQELNSWNGAMGISTERGLLTRLQAEGADTKSGVQSRVFTVRYDAAEVLDKTADADLLKAYEVIAHGGVYGVAWKPFVTRLLELGVKVVKGRVSAYEKDWGHDAHGGERVVTTGALLAVASEIMQEVKLFPANDYDVKWEDGKPKVDDDLSNEGDGGLNVQVLLKEALDDTIAQRANVLDTGQQASDSLRIEIIKALNSRRIVDCAMECEHYAGPLGYYKLDENAPNDEDIDDGTGISKSMLRRQYHLPLDRLNELGVKIELAGLVAQLREVGAIIEPTGNKRYAKKGTWPNPPGEGGDIPSLRIKGEWVHGTTAAD